MNASEAQKELKMLFSKKFGKENVKSEWRSNASAEDWLKFGGIYAPRPDITIGPFNIVEGRNTADIEAVFTQNSTFFNRLDLPNSSTNKNPRCLIAIEIENSGSSKHMIGNIINASLLGKVGIIVTLRDKFYGEAERIYKYLEGAFERKKIELNPSNVVIKKYDELRRVLSQSHR